MASRITYTDKVTAVEQPQYTNAQKTRAADLNEVKTVVNAHADDIETLETGKADTVHTHDAAAVVSGTFAEARIPDLPSSKISDAVDTSTLTVYANNAAAVSAGAADGAAYLLDDTSNSGSYILAFVVNPA